MSGYQKNQERVASVQHLGKELARRAKSKCELCEEGGHKLTIFEPPEPPEDPSAQRALLLCPRCLEGVRRDLKNENDNAWRFLANVVWSELTVVQLVAIRLLRILESQDVEWARETLDMVVPSEEVEAWLAEV